MSLAPLRALLQQRQASIRLVDGKLSLRGPGAALKDQALIELIKSHRDQLLEQLGAGESFNYEAEEAEAIPANLLAPGTERITPELLPLLQIGQEEIDQIVVSVEGGAGAIQDIYPLTPLQEGMLFHYMMADKGDPYLIWSIYAVEDRATLDAYVTTFNQVIARHDILRTCLRWEHLRDPVQVVLREAKVQVEDVELDLADGDIVEQMKARFNPTHYRLDLRVSPLVKLLVARDATRDRLIVMQLMHHLTTDRTTGDVVTSEIIALMTGQAHTLPKPVPYRNFVAHVKSSQGNGQPNAFFEQLLAGVDRTTAPFGLLNVHRDGSGILERSIVLDQDVASRLSRLARIEGVSTTSLLHVAWGHVLAKVCGTDAPVFGTVMFGRLKAGGSNERILGVSINTLPVIVHADRPVIECVRDMQRLLAELLHHEHAPLTVTQKAAGLPSGVPLFTSVVNYRHSGSRDRPLLDAPVVPEAKISFLEQHEGNNYPLTLSVDEYQTALKLSIQAARGIDPEQVLSLTRNALMGIIEALETAQSRALKDIPVLNDEDERQLLNDWQGAPLSEADKAGTMHRYVDQTIAQHPERLAIRAGGTTMTYLELGRRVDDLAGRLQAAGVRRHGVVGVHLPRSIEQVVALLAVFKSGGIYLPLDPDYPAERLDYMARDSGCTVLVTRSNHVGHLSLPVTTTVLVDHDPTPAPPWSDPALAADDTAYILYTSGSTGRPKGVPGLHRMLTSRLLPERALRSGDEVYAQKTSINFIDSLWEVLLPLSTGATIEVIPHTAVQDPQALSRALHDAGISHVVMVPTLLAALVSHLEAGNDRLPALRYCVSSGEPLSADLAARFHAALPHVQLVNIYGTTEFWDASAHTFADVDAGEGAGQAGRGRPVPIGRPMPGVRVYVLDERQRPVPHGVEGELYVSSHGMGTGYIGNPEVTARAFLPSPFIAGERMYRTGDRVIWRQDGGLEYRGRADRQINKHGFRIEPGEIEATLNRHPQVAESVVVARGKDQQLAAYVVPTAGQAAEPVPFGLFYFSDAASTSGTDELALYIESVKQADRLGFSAIWTPERHFTQVGAAFPNPSVLSAAAAMVTTKLQLRSGSVVLPLHDPLRVAEEWAVVDRLSGGRVALSFASGWVPNDFVLAPDNFAHRHEVMLEAIEQVRTLWRGGTITRKNGVGQSVEIAAQPRPVQAELPVWVTAAGAPQTFADAGRIGANVLTHVLNTTVEGLAEKIAAYRAARLAAGHDPASGRVAVMLHTYVGEDAGEAIAEARPHLENYFRSQLMLRKDVGKALGLDVQTDEELSDDVVHLAVDRFLASKALIGCPQSCQGTVRSLLEAGVDEIACLIDFGIPGERVQAALPVLDRLRRSCTRGVRAADLEAMMARELPPYMRPASIVLMDALPLTASGKIDQTALPDPGGTRARPGRVEPRNEMEAELARIWAEVLRHESVGITDGFFELGGNSVSAIRMINRAQKTLGLKISVRELFERQTIEALGVGTPVRPAAAAVLSKLSQGHAAAPLFCVHGGTGDAAHYAKLCAAVGDAATVYAIQYPKPSSDAANPASVGDLARSYIGLIKSVQPTGPYQLLGWSFGGLTVYEMARQLRAAGEDVSFLCLLDALIASGEPPSTRWSDRQALLYMLKVYDLIGNGDDLSELERLGDSAESREALLALALAYLQRRHIYPESARVEDLDRQLSAIKEVIHMSMHYRPGSYDGDLVYVGARDDDHDLDDMVRRWTGLVKGDIDLITVDMRHNRMFDDAHVSQISAIVGERLRKVEKVLAD
jgi:natural product biosynthesis luciferase-like monooxygenase protein/amino acid adenylation domain-containing protein